VQAGTDSLQWIKKEFPGYQLHYTTADIPTIDRIEKFISTGNKEVRKFFKKEFRQSFNIYVFPDRKSMDTQWSTDWMSTVCRLINRQGAIGNKQGNGQ
jgi:adenylate cyclase